MTTVIFLLRMLHKWLDGQSAKAEMTRFETEYAELLRRPEV